MQKLYTFLSDKRLNDSKKIDDAKYIDIIIIKYYRVLLSFSITKYDYKYLFESVCLKFCKIFSVGTCNVQKYLC